jgi:hypothetical protein
MEVWEGQTYSSIMAMPRSRRYRLILKKSDLEKERRARMEQESRRR